MSAQEQKLSRRQHILQALAGMLESDLEGRITTAKLAQEVGVSEAALYRHFPSKTKMFEALIEFIEQTVFERIAVILKDQSTAKARCDAILYLILAFSERNPGMARILVGDALAGENAKLRARVAQFFDRVETQLKQVLREAELKEGMRPTMTVTESANLLISCAEGRMLQFVRSGFKRSPTQYWRDQYQHLMGSFFRELAV
jgi:TetR/AcrR family transcriptional regulator